MSVNFAQILQDDLITPMVRKTAYGLATTCILGAAVYAGYCVAGPEKQLIQQYRHPELNEQVSRNGATFIQRKICCRNKFFLCKPHLCENVVVSTFC